MGDVVTVLAATPPPGTGPLVVTSGGVRITHQLVPGATFVWPITVTADVGQLDSLLGGLSVRGGLARSDDITAEVASCTVAWAADGCPPGEHRVLAPTPLDRLPLAHTALQAGTVPRPGTSFLEVRIHVASDARIPDDGSLTAVMWVDASGPALGSLLGTTVVIHLAVVDQPTGWLSKPVDYTWTMTLAGIAVSCSGQPT